MKSLLELIPELIDKEEAYTSIMKWERWAFVIHTLPNTLFSSHVSFDPYPPRPWHDTVNEVRKSTLVTWKEHETEG